MSALVSVQPTAAAAVSHSAALAMEQKESRSSHWPASIGLKAQILLLQPAAEVVVPRPRVVETALVVSLDRDVVRPSVVVVARGSRDDVVVARGSRDVVVDPVAQSTHAMFMPTSWSAVEDDLELNLSKSFPLRLQPRTLVPLLILSEPVSDQPTAAAAISHSEAESIEQYALVSSHWPA